jgi:hypothetical protein
MRRCTTNQFHRWCAPPRERLRSAGAGYWLVSGKPSTQIHRRPETAMPEASLARFGSDPTVVNVGRRQPGWSARASRRQLGGWPRRRVR